MSSTNKISPKTYLHVQCECGMRVPYTYTIVLKPEPPMKVCAYCTEPGAFPFSGFSLTDQLHDIFYEKNYPESDAGCQ